MKHFSIGIGILAVILVLGLITLGIMNRELEKTAETLTEAWTACCKGDHETAKTAAERARRDWDKGYGLTASFADHEPLDEVNRVFSRMEACGVLGEWDEFAQTCRELISLIHGIADREKPLYYNIL